MRGVCRRFKLGVLIALFTVATASMAAATGRVDREGVCNLGGWFQYGLIEGKSRYGLDFSNGPGYNLHFRYNVSRRAALIFYFDNQTYDTKGDPLSPTDDLKPPINFKLTGVHAGIRMFSVPTGDVLRFVEASVGFYRPEIKFSNTQQQSIGNEFCFPNEGFLLHAGAGMEIFFTQAWALGLGIHGYGLSGKGLCRNDSEELSEGSFSVSGQAAIGVEYYLFR